MMLLSWYYEDLFIKEINLFASQFRGRSFYKENVARVHRLSFNKENIARVQCLSFNKEKRHKL